MDEEKLDVRAEGSVDVQSKITETIIANSDEVEDRIPDLDEMKVIINT